MGPKKDEFSKNSLSSLWLKDIEIKPNQNETKYQDWRLVSK